MPRNYNYMGFVAEPYASPYFEGGGDRTVMTEVPAVIISGEEVLEGVVAAAVYAFRSPLESVA